MVFKDKDKKIKMHDYAEIRTHNPPHHWQVLYQLSCTDILATLQSPAVRVTAVTVTVGYSDTFGNPRSITNKTQAVTVTKNRLQ